MSTIRRPMVRRRDPRWQYLAIPSSARLPDRDGPRAARL